MGLIFLFGEKGMSQSGISGKVTDKETGEEMIAANVQVFQKGVFVQGETTDIDGDFTMVLEPGTYKLIVSYTGFRNEKITDVEIKEKEFIRMDVSLSVGSRTEILCVGCLGNVYRIPLVNHEKTSTGKTTCYEEIKNLPTRNINEIITLTPGLSLTQ